MGSEIRFELLHPKSSGLFRKNRSAFGGFGAGLCRFFCGVQCDVKTTHGFFWARIFEIGIFALKIVYLTDIHDGLRGLKKILIDVEADIYLFSGDIIYKAFFYEDRIIEFVGLQEEFNELVKNEDITPYDYATRVVRFKEKYPSALVEKSELYRKLFQKAAKNMKEKYAVIEEMIQQHANAPVVCLPGNYDIDLHYTDLYERDIHRKTFEFQDLKFAGYGGAPISTSGIPEKLAVVFHEYMHRGKIYSEPEIFFREENPDIVMIHNPSFGFLDKIPGYGNIGSQGIRNYLDEYNPKLVLSGHVHEDPGLIKKRNTIFLNPSNFGAVDSVYGFQPGGFYGEIFFQNKDIVKVNWCRLENESPQLLLSVDTTEKTLRVLEKHGEGETLETQFVRVQ